MIAISHCRWGIFVNGRYNSWQSKSLAFFHHNIYLLPFFVEVVLLIFIIAEV